MKFKIEDQYFNIKRISQTFSKFYNIPYDITQRIVFDTTKEVLRDVNNQLYKNEGESNGQNYN